MKDGCGIRTSSTTASISADPTGAVRHEVDFPGETSGLGWLPDGRLLMVDRLARTVVRQEPDGSLVTHGNLAPWATFHGNDMVVAGDGRAYVGNFGFDLDAIFAGTASGSSITTASLVRIDPDGTSHEAATELSFPNGSVITPDGLLLIVAESMGSRLRAFDIAADGTLSNARVWADLPGIAPDGICLDAEGCIWVANALGNECVRVAEGGTVSARVSTELHCYACMLGGEDRRTLYVVTAPSSAAHERQSVREGVIVQAQVEVPGAGLP